MERKPQPLRGGSSRNATFLPDWLLHLCLNQPGGGLGWGGVGGLCVWERGLSAMKSQNTEFYFQLQHVQTVCPQKALRVLMVTMIALDGSELVYFWMTHQTVFFFGIVINHAGALYAWTLVFFFFSCIVLHSYIPLTYLVHYKECLIDIFKVWWFICSSWRLHFNHTQTQK